ncbi:MAG: HAMP domain-containing histidine kinase [Lachnospiraceae bacterium]|nr:HAMP domain-containing histidine kinase [Lachnospiraceae bacterium]
MQIMSIVLFVLVIGQAIWHQYSKMHYYDQIDRAEELLRQMVEQAGKHEVAEEQWQQWKIECERHYHQGAMGRLYGRIWEVAQIDRDREHKHGQEFAYLQELMQDISHQMKTPLAALSVFFDVFSGQLKQEQSREREMVEQARRQIGRMRWLVQGMLKLAQVESGVLRYDFQNHAVKEVIDRSIDALQTKWEEKSLCIRVQENEEEQIILKQDAGWMQEAYQNILKNAIEYAPVGSTITIAIEQTSLAVIISIEDQGEGISETELPKIFNRFYRVRKSGQNDDGVGIGLALAKSIVEAQGGILTVYSQTGQESYTRFVMTFLKKLV